MKTIVFAALMMLTSVFSMAQISSEATYENCSIGYKFLTGRFDVPQDFEKAMKYFTIASKGTGDFKWQAITYIGYCYFNGLGVPQDRHHAVVLFEQSAPMGNEFAQLYLYYLYWNGEYVKKDKAKAEYWWNQCKEYFDVEQMKNYIIELYHPEVKFRGY